LPAKVIVAPNSPSALAQDRASPAITEGRIRGKVILKNIFEGEAPSVSATFSESSFIERKADSTATTKKGIETKTAARIDPVVLNGRVIPNQLLSHLPKKPCLPKAKSKAVPPTTGGRTIGRSTIARRSLINGNFALAKNHAIGVPNASTIRVAEKLTISDRKKASETTSVPRRSTKPDQGILCRSPRRGDKRKRIAKSAISTTVFGSLFMRKTMFMENSFGDFGI